MDRVKNFIIILITGVFLGYLCNAVINYLTLISEAEKVKQFSMWSMAGFDGILLYQSYILFGFTAVLTIISIMVAKYVEATTIGEGLQSNIPYSIKKIRVWTIYLTSAMVGISVSYAGPISFIGIFIPYLTRQYFIHLNAKSIVIINLLVSANFMVLCDIISHLKPFGSLLPVNMITSAVGIPIMIYILLKQLRFSRI